MWSSVFVTYLDQTKGTQEILDFEVDNLIVNGITFTMYLGKKTPSGVSIRK